MKSGKGTALERIGYNSRRIYIFISIDFFGDIIYNVPRNVVSMDIIDKKNKCYIEGCNNLGEWNKLKGNLVYRRKLCGSHHKRLTGEKRPEGRSSYVREVFKKIKCGFCEYCGWEGPCDCHRPNPGRYSKDNMRSTCPNCHRLISKGLLIDKYKTITKVEL